jgi:hypothetical protein
VPLTALSTSSPATATATASSVSASSSFLSTLSRTTRSCRQRTKTSASSLPNGRGLVRGSFSSCLEVAQEDGQLTKPPRNYRRRMKTCANSLPKSSTCDSMASPFFKTKARHTTS